MKKTTLTTLLMLAAACGTASAQSVLLSDTFNTGGVNGTVDSFDTTGANGAGAGGVASRQTGTLAPINYFSKSAYQNINNNQVIFSPGYGAAWGEGRLVINHDFALSLIHISEPTRR